MNSNGEHNIGGYMKSSKKNKTSSSKSSKSTKSYTSSKSSKSSKSSNSTSGSKSKSNAYNKWLGLYMKDTILNFKKKDIKDIYLKIYKVSKIGATKHTNIEGKKKFLEGVKRNNGNKLFNFMNKKNY